MTRMETFRVELTAPTDAATLHAYLEDLAHHPEWRFDVASSTLRGGLPGGVGAHYEQRVRAGDEERTVEVELMDSERPVMVVFRAVDGHETLDVGVGVESAEQGSRITLDLHCAWDGRPWHRRPRGAPSAEERAARYGRGLAERFGGSLA